MALGLVLRRVAVVPVQWAPVQQAAFRAHGQCKQRNHDHNCNNSSSNNNKGHFFSSLSKCHSNYHNHHCPRNSNSNRIYAAKAFSNDLMESLEEVRVVLLGQTLVETLVPT